MMTCLIVFPNGRFMETGSTFASATYRVLAHFAQAPSDGECQGVLAYHINSGHYGETPLDGLNVIMVGGFKGNIWAGEAKDATAAFFFDERANEKAAAGFADDIPGKGWEALEQNLQRSLETS